ncbi:MAG TPA: metal-dependent hydrolase [Rhizomicrobium sp.]|nr:metal-dependent hydrolase [Rhizomicrobium sp.]
MPNRDVHRPVGITAGAGAAYIGARNLPPLQQFVETIGGGAGGLCGAIAPDKIDPPTSPNHRHYGHGVANFVGAVFFTAEQVARLQQRLRAKADDLLARRAYLTNDLDRALNWIAEMFLRFVVGFLNGFTAGYLSHLLLDALTAQGIPIFARGC